MMPQSMPFADVLEAADHLSEDEQLELIAILNRRLAEACRARLIREVAQSRKEHARGEYKAVTPDELMREILE